MMQRSFIPTAIRFLLPVAVGLFIHTSLQAQFTIDSKELSADIVRVLSKDLFDLNSVPFMQPMVETFNATANAGLYRSSRIPTGDTLYIRLGFRGMAGFVRNDQRTFQPNIPTESTENEVVSGLAVLIADRIKTIFRKGVEEDSISVPAESATILGNMASEFVLNNGYILRELKSDPAYKQAVALGLDSTLLDEVILGLPAALDLPQGADISTILAVVPQLEIGSLFGTELLLRYVPPIKLDSNVGRFTFWGVGIRHNISQYFTEEVDLALLVAYQGTNLENTVGVTGARLDADAASYNATISGSRQIGSFIGYTGIGIERTDIDVVYRFTLPRQLQAQLGLITPNDLDQNGVIDDDEFVPDPENGFPGDTKPQTSTVSLSDTRVNLTVGGEYRLGPVSLFADVKIGGFTVLSAGVAAHF